MTDLINAVEHLNSRDWFDYVSAFSPLVLSCIAIFIALYTSKKQNSISIFEKRYRNYSELLDFFSAWKIFVDHFNRIYKQNEENFVDEISKLCLTIYLLELVQSGDIDISEYIKDKRIDRDKVRDALINLQFKNSSTLEMASLVYGRYTRRIDLFRRKYIVFHENLEKVTLDRFTKEAFYKEVIEFQKHLETFYRLFFTKIKPKVRIID